MLRIGMMVVSLMLAVEASANAGPVNSTVAGYQNTPGLSCRVITLAAVYSEPSKSSRYLGRTRSFIAVTGTEVQNFFPIVTGRGIRGWVDSQEVEGARSGGHVDRCWVQQAPDGRLLFGWSQPGSG